MNIKISLILGLFLLASCQQNGDCLVSQTDKVELLINRKNGGTIFSALPENVEINGYIQSLGKKDVPSNYRLSHERYILNRNKLNSLKNPNYVIGMNKLQYTASCLSLDDNNRLSCGCGDSMRFAVKEFEVVDTMRIWIKKIEYWQQFGSPRPDVYLVINNFGSKSGVSRNFDYANDGKKVWNIDDTFTISKKYFNMHISAWDDDRVGKDEHVKNSLIMGSDMNYWSTGTHQSYDGVTGFTFEVVRL